MSRAKGPFGRWLQRVLDSDPRYICGVCDDRFGCQFDGIEHVLRCHPEFAGVALPVEDGVSEPVDTVPARAARTAPNPPLVRVPLWG